MNPYDTSSDTLYRSVGNPHLLPVRTQRFVAGYTFNKSGVYLSPQLSYRTVADYIVPAGINDGRIYTQTCMNDAHFGELDGMHTLRYNGRLGNIGGSAGYRRAYFTNIDRGTFYTNINFNAGYRKMSVNGYAQYSRYSFTPLSITRNHVPESEVSFNWTVNSAVKLQAGMRYILGGLKSETYRDDQGYRTGSTQEMLDRRYLATLGLSANLKSRTPKNRTEKRLYQNESGIELE